MLAEGGGSLVKHLGIEKVLTENNYIIELLSVVLILFE